MNFLVCDSNYISNYLFDVIGWIMILSLLLLFVFISIKGCKLIGKFVKNKFLMIFLDIILCFSMLILFLCFLSFILLYSITFVVDYDADWRGSNYYDNKYYFGFHYLVMSISLLLDFMIIYYSVFKMKISKLKDELIIKTKKKKWILRFLLINILCIGIFSGTYLILDKVAPKYDYYSSNCGSD